MTGPWGREYSKVWSSHLGGGEGLYLGPLLRRWKVAGRGQKDKTMGIATSGKSQKSSGDQQVGGRSPGTQMVTTHRLMEDVQSSGLPTLWPLENAILITFLRAHAEEIPRALRLGTSGVLLVVSSPQASSLSGSSKSGGWISADSNSAPQLFLP